MDILSNLKHATQVIWEIFVTDDGAKPDDSNVNVKINSWWITVKEWNRVWIWVWWPRMPLEVKWTWKIEFLLVDENAIVDKDLRVNWRAWIKQDFLVQWKSTFKWPVKINNTMFLSGAKAWETMRFLENWEIKSSSHLQNLWNKILVKSVPFEIKTDGNNTD